MRLKDFCVIIFACVFVFTSCEQNPRYVLPEKTIDAETEKIIEIIREEPVPASEKEKTKQTTPEQLKPEQEQPKEPIMLKPIIEYPAYILDQCGTLWGIPSSLMGESHKERVKIETVEGEELPSSSLVFFVKSGVAYIAHEYTDEKEKSCVDYYAQELGTKIPTLKLVDSIPVFPEADRVTVNNPEWLIESTVISGTEWSYLYNRNAAVWGGAGKGEWICRKEKVTGYVILSGGIVIMSESGGEFCPSNRKALNAVSEPGRLWK